jgi:hypothetical protein
VQALSTIAAYHLSIGTSEGHREAVAYWGDALDGIPILDTELTDSDDVVAKTKVITNKVIAQSIHTYFICACSRSCIPGTSKPIVRRAYAKGRPEVYVRSVNAVHEDMLITI